MAQVELTPEQRMIQQTAHDLGPEPRRDDIRDVKNPDVAYGVRVEARKHSGTVQQGDDCIMQTCSRVNDRELEVGTKVNRGTALGAVVGGSRENRATRDVGHALALSSRGP